MSRSFSRQVSGAALWQYTAVAYIRLLRPPSEKPPIWTSCCRQGGPSENAAPSTWSVSSKKAGCCRMPSAKSRNSPSPSGSPSSLRPYLPPSRSLKYGMLIQQPQSRSLTICSCFGNISLPLTPIAADISLSRSRNSTAGVGSRANR